MEYNFDWLKANYNECDDYEVNEFKYSCADGTKLNCVKWVRDPDADLCVVYLHTSVSIVSYEDFLSWYLINTLFFLMQTRSLCDATELLPLCNLLNANLLSFDQRGSGKSEGQLSFHSVNDLTAIIESLGGGNDGVKVILWARGMASSFGIQYVTKQQDIMKQWIRTAPARRMVAHDKRLRRQEEKQRSESESGEKLTVVVDEDDESDEEEAPSQYVKFLVLDSPYTSLKEVVLEATKHIDVLGGVIPPVFVKFALYMFKNKIQESLDIDPYSVSPLQWVSQSQKMQVGHEVGLPPCYILAADNDEVAISIASSCYTRR